nr:hypothetical protein [Tanacetum cinerariifolium]
EVQQPLVDAQIVPRAVDAAAVEHLKRALRHRRLGADAGEARRSNTVEQGGAEWAVGGAGPVEHR